MSKFIHPEKIDQLKAVMRIEEVVRDHVELKKTGASYTGVCPWHGGSSFTVTPAKGFFKCFGCGKGGDAIRFVMEHKRLSYPEAIQLLFDKYNIL